MKRSSLLLISFLLLMGTLALAQVPGQIGACGEPDVQVCDPLLNLGQGQFTATPLMDGTMQDYGDPDHNIVSLYGSYGNNESAPVGPNAQKALTHYNQGIDLAAKIKPLCPSGLDTGCQDNQKAIVFLVIGFSNCAQEICGGALDAFDPQRKNHGLTQLSGQPCATQCPNKGNPDFLYPWNQANNYFMDPISQESFLKQIYPQTGPSLVGTHVVVWGGALGAQTLNKWDPTPAGYYATNDCFSHGFDPECNYKRVRNDLNYNFSVGGTHFTENQVQAIFIKASDSFPNCDLKHLYCTTDSGDMPDAYLSEQYLGNILRYLKCCKLNADGSSSGVPRYPNLQQVFIASRTYGGYANGMPHGCLMPEPFAYEHGFAVQRAIVAQINSVPGGDPAPYIGAVDYTLDANGNNVGHAPWFDWGPYLWTNGVSGRSDQLRWCGGQGGTACLGTYDVRSGDLSNQTDYWGDFTHPTAQGEGKVATQLVKWVQGTLPSPQSYISQWLGVGSATPWIQK